MEKQDKSKARKEFSDKLEDKYSDLPACETVEEYAKRMGMKYDLKVRPYQVEQLESIIQKGYAVPPKIVVVKKGAACGKSEGKIPKITFKLDTDAFVLAMKKATMAIEEFIAKAENRQQIKRNKVRCLHQTLSILQYV